MKSLPKENFRSSLVVQWYITRCSQCREFISGQGTEILHDAWFSQNSEIDPQLSRTSGCRLYKLLLFSPPVSPGVCSRLSMYMCAKLLQSCLTLCNPMDCTLPGSSVHGFLQARILEWVAFILSRGFSWPRDQTCISYISCIGRRVLYLYSHLGSPRYKIIFIGKSKGWSSAQQVTTLMFCFLLTYSEFLKIWDMLVLTFYRKYSLEAGIILKILYFPRDQYNVKHIIGNI